MRPPDEVRRDLVRGWLAKAEADLAVAELYVQMKIETGLRQLDEGRGLSHHDARKRLPEMARLTRLPGPWAARKPPDGQFSA
jgi:hypothetical protein